jgi:Multidrug resistance efflux pump
VKSRPVEYTVTAVGSVEAFEKVQVTARVAGVVEQVKFVEGESVETGTALVEIEPRRYQLSVEAARANVQKAEAAKADAEAALARRQPSSRRTPASSRARRSTRSRRASRPPRPTSPRRSRRSTRPS